MKLVNLDNHLKIKMINNEKIIIENFNNLIDCSKDLLVFDNILIIGDFLTIKIMEEGFASIDGKIKKIEFIEKN